jgi:hypothetical protein
LLWATAAMNPSIWHAKSRTTIEKIDHYQLWNNSQNC